jgi:hypothetical protein
MLGMADGNGFDTPSCDWEARDEVSSHFLGDWLMEASVSTISRSPSLPCSLLLSFPFYPSPATMPRKGTGMKSGVCLPRSSLTNALLLCSYMLWPICGVVSAHMSEDSDLKSNPSAAETHSYCLLT